MIRRYKNAREFFTYLFSYFPLDNLWEFFIDGRHRHYGPLVYDHSLNKPNNPYVEVGYLNNMVRTFLVVMPQTLGDRLNSVMLADIHDSCVRGMAHLKHGLKADYKDHTPVWFNLILNRNISAQGLAEIKRSRHYGHRFHFVRKTWQGNINVTKRLYKAENITIAEISDCSPETSVYVETCYGQDYYWVPDAQLYVYKDRPEEKRLEREFEVQCEIDDFYNQKNEYSTNNTLYRICLLIRTLCLMHPFADANSRTITMITLNKLLLDHGMLPTMLEDANCFGGFAIHELMQKVLLGQRYFSDHFRYNLQRLDRVIDYRMTIKNYEDFYPTMVVLDEDAGDAKYYDMTTFTAVKKQFFKLHYKCYGYDKAALILWLTRWCQRQRSGGARTRLIEQYLSREWEALENIVYDDDLAMAENNHYHFLCDVLQQHSTNILDGDVDYPLYTMR